MDTLTTIFLYAVALFLGNLVTACSCLLLSRTQPVRRALRILAGFLLALDLGLMAMVLPVIFGPSNDEITGWGGGWNLIALTIFLLFLLPGMFLFWAAFKHEPPTP
jgi:hypothetical protein